MVRKGAMFFFFESARGGCAPQLLLQHLGQAETTNVVAVQCCTDEDEVDGNERCDHEAIPGSEAQRPGVLAGLARRPTHPAKLWAFFGVGLDFSGGHAAALVFVSSVSLLCRAGNRPG